MFNGTIWKRDFELKVVYDRFANEEILPEQKEAYELFRIAKDARNESVREVEMYCLDKNRDEVEDEQVDDIFRYVMPEQIYVTRDGRVAVMCRYRFDPEHGIAVVFKKGQYECICAQDIIL